MAIHAKTTGMIFPIENIYLHCCPYIFMDDNWSTATTESPKGVAYKGIRISWRGTPSISQSRELLTQSLLTPCYMVGHSLELMARNTTFDQQQALSNLNWPSSSLLLVSSSWFWIIEGVYNLGPSAMMSMGPNWKSIKISIIGLLC